LHDRAEIGKSVSATRNDTRISKQTLILLAILATVSSERQPVLTYRIVGTTIAAVRRRGTTESTREAPLHAPVVRRLEPADRQRWHWPSLKRRATHLERLDGSG
jgi:hypothetical protein